MIAECTKREAALKQLDSRDAVLRDAETPTTPRLALGTREITPREASDERLAMRDEDVAAIGHDLRAPLAVIALEVTMLADKLPQLSKGARHALDRINRNPTYLHNLLQDLLDLSAIDAARFEVSPERIELCGLVADVIDRMVASRDRPRVSVCMTGLVFLSADGRRIERVLANLVQNALKYTPGSSQITVAVEVKDGRARVSVIDTGPGLPPDEASRVFDKFRRSRTTNHREGAGLGLYVSRKIVEAHGGRIGVDTVFGRGSRFWFELPLLEARTL
jgi:signal transduction histidine kinase